MGLKDAYLAWEDKWYGFIDRISAKVPVNKLTDAVDKVVPSFVLFLAIVILLVLFVGVPLLWGLVMPQTFSFSVEVRDDSGQPLPYLPIKFSFSGQEKTITTDEFGSAEEKLYVLAGTEVRVTIEKEGYEPFSEKFTVNASKTERIELAGIKKITRTILLRNEFNQPVREPLTIRFACRNPDVAAPASRSNVTSGSVTVDEPHKCNGLIVSVTDAVDYESVESYAITGATQTIYLKESAAATATGAIRVELYDNSELADETMTVELYRDNGIDGTYVDSETTNTGIAEFEKMPGLYFVKTVASQGYGVSRSSVFTLEANETEKIQLSLTESVVGEIRIKVVDKSTQNPADDALVTLMRGGSQISNRRTDENADSIVEFSVSEDTAYKVIVDKDGYCIKVVHDVTISESVQKVELQRFTSSCGAKLKVLVLDEDAKPVSNATVSLHNEDGFATGYKSRITDVNGIAEFPNIQSGDYKAFAFKGAGSNWSDVTHFIMRGAEDIQLTVALVSSEGVVRARVVDNDGKPMQFANVAFVDAFDNKVIGGGAKPVEAADGTVELTTKADKRLYIVASKEGYANFTSTVYDVLPNTLQEITAVLEKEIVSGEIGVKFKGLYKNGKRVTTVSQDKEYTAVFQLRIPKERNYRSVGLHIRTSSRENSEKMELDKIVIKSLNVPGSYSVVKATSYNPANGYENDSSHITADEAKWVNIEWSGLQHGIVEVEAVVRVKKTATVEDSLEIKYRAWAVTADYSWERSPLDNRFGDNESAPGLDSLYADCHSQIFQVGIETLCDEKFCFTANVLDIENDLVEPVTDGYSSKIFNSYRLNFTVINNSDFETDSYPNADMEIENPDEALLFGAYTIYPAQQAPRIEGNANSSKIEWVNVQDFTRKESITASIGFVPENALPAAVTVKVRSGQRIVFEKTVSIDVSAAKEFKADLVPELLASGIENTVTVTVKDSSSDLEVRDATVKILNKYSDVIAQMQTNTKGIAVVKLPGLMPGESVKLLIEKPDYAVFEKELKVNEKIVEIKPETIGMSLNAKTMQETENRFSIKNLAPFALTIEKIEIVGDAMGLLDTEQMNNWLYSFQGDTIAAEEFREFALKSFLTPEGKRVQETKSASLEMNIELSAMEQSWGFEVPIKASIGLGGEVDDPSCLNVTRHEWKTATEGQPVKLTMELENTCSISGTPIALKDIEVKAAWESNQIGDFKISTEHAAGEVRSGYFKKIIGTLDADSSISIVVTFEPDAGVSGTAKARVLFRAHNATDSGKQLLEDALSAEITVTNLLGCIAFSKELLVIEAGESDSFTIETLDCGDDTRIKLKSELSLGSHDFTMKSKDSKDIEVPIEQRFIPGQYPIYVFAKTASAVDEKFVKMIRVRVPSQGCLELSRYEFDVFDNPDDPYDGYDTAEVINKCYDAPITMKVEWSEKDWKEALKQGLIFGLISGVLGGLSSWLEPSAQQTTAAGTGAAATQTTAKAGQPSGQGHTGGAAVPAQTTQGTQKAAGSTGSAENKTTAAQQSELAQASQADASASVSGNPEPTFFERMFSSFGSLTKWFTGGEETYPRTEDTAVYEGIRVGPAQGLGTPTGLFLGSDNDDDSGMFMMMAMMGGLGGMGGGSGFFGSFLRGTIMGTLFAMSRQGEDTFEVTTIERDLVDLAYKLLMAEAGTESGGVQAAESTDITVSDLEESSTEPNPENPGTSIGISSIAFVNQEAVVQKDASTPLFRTLRIDGERLEYEEYFEFDEETQPEAEVAGEEPHTEKFHLQFNSFKPEDVSTPAVIPNCFLGGVAGQTGKNYKPRIKLEWSWDSISENECDEGNPDYVYCDATQFSISLLKKVERIKRFIEDYAPFNCPSAEGISSTKEQALVGTAYDVGITKLQVVRAGQDANVWVSIESNNSGKTMQGSLTVNVYDYKGESAGSCTQQFSVTSKAIASCVVKDLSEGVHDANAVMAIQLCEGCENNDVENDRISTSFYFGTTGIEQCTPYNTKRLSQFIQATEAAGNSAWSAAEREEILGLVKFNTHLIKDAYTLDFRKDFDEYCRTKSFFDCASYYLEENGLGKLFADADRFKFDYGGAPNAPIDAGKYAAEINIGFDSNDWGFFDSEGNPNAQVTVKLVELQAPEPNSPFYYLPFNGNVGVDSSNGRQGYGVNFKQDSPQTIKVNEDLQQSVVTTTIAGSTPVFGGWVKAGFNDSFEILNQRKRGILLEITTRDQETDIVLSPSYATPVMMRVDYSKGEHAFGFYSVELDNSPQVAFSKMVPWTGVGSTCRAFTDELLVDAFNETWDMKGTNAGCARFNPGSLKEASFGVEWCSPSRTGSVWLMGVVFTPQGKSGLMQRTGYGDEMTLIGVDSSGERIALNGVPGMEFNSYGTSSIDSVQDILDLVENEKICIIGANNRVRQQFFWNPKAVLEEIRGAVDIAETECITE